MKIPDWLKVLLLVGAGAASGSGAVTQNKVSGSGALVGAGATMIALVTTLESTAKKAVKKK